MLGIGGAAAAATFTVFGQKSEQDTVIAKPIKGHKRHWTGVKWTDVEYDDALYNAMGGPFEGDVSYRMDEIPNDKKIELGQIVPINTHIRPYVFRGDKWVPLGPHNT